MSSLQASGQQLDPQNIPVLKREATHYNRIPPGSARRVVYTQVNRAPIRGEPAPAARCPARPPLERCTLPQPCLVNLPLPDPGAAFSSTSWRPGLLLSLFKDPF